MANRIVESCFDAASGRWKNRVVGGPDLPNEYVHLDDAASDGRGFADFLGCGFRVVDDAARAVAGAGPDGAPPPEPGPVPRTAGSRPSPRGSSRLETGETADVEDPLHAELAAQVAVQLAAAAHEYAVAAHERAAHLHRVEADHLESVGEFERAELQRKAAAVDEDLAAGPPSHPAG